MLMLRAQRTDRREFRQHAAFGEAREIDQTRAENGLAESLFFFSRFAREHAEIRLQRGECFIRAQGFAVPFENIKKTAADVSAQSLDLITGREREQHETHLARFVFDKIGGRGFDDLPKSRLRRLRRRLFIVAGERDFKSVLLKAGNVQNFGEFLSRNREIFRVIAARRRIAARRFDRVGKHQSHERAIDRVKAEFRLIRLIRVRVEPRRAFRFDGKNLFTVGGQIDEFDDELIVGLIAERAA